MSYSHVARVIGRPTPHRRIVTGRRDCFTGEMPSTKKAMKYRMVAWEGIVCRDMLIRTDYDKQVVEYQEEPAPFPWYDGKIFRRYYPDAIKTLKDGRRFVMEAKRLNVVRKRGLKEVYKLVELGALDAGYDGFELWTEAETHAGPDLVNANLIRSEATSRTTNESHLHTMRTTLLKLGGQATIRQLRHASGIGDQAYRTVLRLIFLQEFDFRPSWKEIDDHSEIVWSSAGERDDE
jgi:hypothetical protein